jgi:hypothetical protein
MSDNEKESLDLHSNLREVFSSADGISSEEMMVNFMETICDQLEALQKVIPFDDASSEFRFNEMSDLLARMQQLCKS